MAIRRLEAGQHSLTSARAEAQQQLFSLCISPAGIAEDSLQTSPHFSQRIQKATSMSNPIRILQYDDEARFD